MTVMNSPDTALATCPHCAELGTVEIGGGEVIDFDFGCDCYGETTAELRAYLAALDERARGRC